MQLLFIRSPDLPSIDGMSGGITVRELINVLNHELSLSHNLRNTSANSNTRYSNNYQPFQPSSSSSSSAAAAASTSNVENNNENNGVTSPTAPHHRPAKHLVLILRSPIDLMLPSHEWKKKGKKVVKKRPKKMSLDELMRYESDSEDDEEGGDKDAFGSLYSMTQSFLTTGALGKVSTVPAAATAPPPPGTHIHHQCIPYITHL